MQNGAGEMLLLGTGKHRGAAGGWGEKITDAVKLCRAPTREQSAIGCSSVIRCRRTYQKSVPLIISVRSAACWLYATGRHYCCNDVERESLITLAEAALRHSWAGQLR